MKYEILFSPKRRKYTDNLSSAEFHQEAKRYMLFMTNTKDTEIEQNLG